MPPPLPLPPTTPPAPPRAGPRRWPGQLLLAAVSMALTVGIVYLVRTIDDARGAVRRATSPDEVRAVLEAQAAAWNRGDLDGFMAEYWKDDRLTFASGGTVTRGWQATLDRYRKKYQADGKEMGTLTFSDLEPQPLAADAVLVLGRWRLVFAKSEERPNGLFTLVVRKTPDGWKVVHDHTSAAEPAKKE